MDNMILLKASCLCRQASHDIEISASDLPLRSTWDHSNASRHVSGAMCTTSAILPDNYQPAHDLFGCFFSYRISSDVTRYHCKICGCCMLARQLSTETINSPVSWVIMTGTLERGDGVVDLAAHLCVDDTLDGGCADFMPSFNGRKIPRFAGSESDGLERPLPWLSPIASIVALPASQRVHCYCNCRGVEFWIAQPSERSKGPHAPPQGDDIHWWLKDNDRKFYAGVCACNSCRLSCGYDYTYWTILPVADISLDADGNLPFTWEFGTLRSWRSTDGPEGADRYFCRTCGATVFYKGLGRPGVVDVGVGLMDAPEGARAESVLAWRTSRAGFRKDALERSEDLLAGVEEGLRSYGERQKQGNQPS